MRSKKKIMEIKEIVSLWAIISRKEKHKSKKEII